MKAAMVDSLYLCGHSLSPLRQCPRLDDFLYTVVLNVSVCCVIKISKKGIVPSSLLSIVKLRSDVSSSLMRSSSILL